MDVVGIMAAFCPWCVCVLHSLERHSGLLYRVDWYVVIDVSTVQDPEDEGAIMIRNFGNCILFGTAEYPRNPESLAAPL